MPDRTVVCTDCRASFVFTEAEQTFFAERALAPPKRCKVCRQARRRGRTSGIIVKSGALSPFSEEASSGTITVPPPRKDGRARYEIRCVECGAAAEVPFKPIPGRAVYCPTCHQNRKGLLRQATDGVVVDESDEGIIE